MGSQLPTILITDDVKTHRTCIKRCLDGYGYRFLEAKNGQEALDILRTTSIDLIILDLMMPVLDGFTFLEKWHTDPQHASIPVIVNSSLEDRQSMQKALTLGSYDYFIKTLPQEHLRFVLPLKVKNAIGAKQLLDAVRTQKASLEREIQAAGKYQRFLLPRDFRAIGIEVETFFHPYIGVGGDFFDFVSLTHDRTACIIADVSGHGVLAAMVAAILKALFRQYIRDTASLLQTFTHLNEDFLALTDESLYLTAFAAIYDPAQRTLQYVNAGHPPALYFRHTTGIIDVLTATGGVLGLFETTDWLIEERLLAVTPGDRLLLVTDGVTEACVDTCPCFGVDGLQQVVRDTAAASLQETLAQLWQRLQAHTQHQFTDDITCIAMRFQEMRRPQVIQMSNDPCQVQQVVETVVKAMGDLGSPQDRHAIEISLTEMLMNAIEHGNLAIGYARKRAALEAGTFDELVESRRHTAPFAARKVTLAYVIEPARAVFTIRDAGAGFDWHTIPDPRSTANVSRAHGRGILIAQTHMDACTFRPPGNEVTLVKYLSPRKRGKTCKPGTP
jgi:serine phosphatase RsbU (regulator of sigma subunit)